MADTDTYTFTGTFSRSLSADIPVLEAQGHQIPDLDYVHPSPETVIALVAQLVKELQFAYDDGGADGSFNLDTVTIHSVTYNTLTGKPV